MSYKEELSYEDITKNLNYNPTTGLFKRKSRGKETVITFDSFCSAPKVNVFVRNKKYNLMLSIVAWFIVYKEWPKDDEIVFFKDFNKFNLKINNLMKISRKEHYSLITAYKNITEYCNIKPHKFDQLMCSVKYIENNRMKKKPFHDVTAAQSFCRELITKYRHFIIANGAIPPC